ncbi:MAG: NifU family protein [Actinomycetes bacterium]
MTSTVPRADAQELPAAGFERLAQAVDEAARAVAELEPSARQAAQSLREAIEAAHRVALTTIVRRLRADGTGRELLFELVDDPLVRMIFSLHGIIWADPAARARTVLDGVRPGLASHGGDVELDHVQDGVAYVRLSGACNGCSMSSVTMRTMVEQALVGQVAEITAVEVLPSQPGPTLIPLDALRRGGDTHPASHDAGWVRALRVEDVPDGRITAVRLTTATGGAQDVIVVRIDSQMTAYTDQCAHQGLPLGEALLDTAAATLTCPWHGFRYDALSGECISAPGVALEQLPLRVDGSDVWIRAGR